MSGGLFVRWGVWWNKDVVQVELCMLGWGGVWCSHVWWNFLGSEVGFFGDWIGK